MTCYSMVNAQYYNGYGNGGGGWGGYGGGFYPNGGGGGYVRDPRQLQGYEPGYAPGSQTYGGDVPYRAPNWWSQSQRDNAAPSSVLSISYKCNDPHYSRITPECYLSR